MIYRVYSVFDSKVNAYMTPHFRRSKGEILREFSDVVNNKSDNGIYLHPEDFFLYELGSFDDNTGVLVMHANIESLGCALEFKKHD